MTLTNKDREIINKLLLKEYESEFKIIDGINQHPEGLNFEQWKHKYENRGLV